MIERSLRPRRLLLVLVVLCVAVGATMFGGHPVRVARRAGAAG